MINTLSDMDKEIVNTFAEQFAHIKNEPIVLYGLGEKTKLLLDNLKDFKFVALLDKNSVGTMVFDLPVVSPNDVKNFSNNIIIVCTYASKNIIFNRISYLINEGINIYYMNGEKLVNHVNSNIEYKTYNDLIKMIHNNDVISFDIFDTLLVRKTINATSIFQIIEKKGYKNFTQIRLLAEKSAQNKYGICYTLDNIYEFIDDKSFKDIEVKLEIKNAYPKKEVIDAFNYAQNLNKKVLITSDMYFNMENITNILNKIGITGNFDLNISSEIKKSKYDGSVFKYYREKYNVLKILHIGDDEYADIEQAKKYGFETFLVPKTEIVLLNKTKDINDKLILGTFISKAEDAFSDRLSCKKISNVGFFIAPLILNYMNWLYAMTKKEGIDKILFIARDGYLLEKIYQLYPSDKPKGIYFYTSRRNLGVCSIKSKQDIIDVFNTYYASRKITIKKFINSAFGVMINSKFTETYLNEVNKEDLLSFILEHSEEILDNARKENIEYQNYINSVSKNCKKLAMINFVSSGTTQHFAEKVINNNIKVYCFQTTPDIKKVNINFGNLYSLYGNFVSPYTSNSALSKHYHMLEAILTSPEEQFVKFENGKKVFVAEKNDNFFNIEKVHKSILDFINEIITMDNNWYKKNYDNELVENILDLLYNVNYTDVEEEIKTKFKITDGFSQNREVTGLW